jgi:Zn-dependent protease
VSYIAHEIAHKAYAEKLNFRARFVLDWRWAIMSLFVSVFSWVLGIGFIIVALGSVVISQTGASEFGKTYQRISKNEEGKIAFVGPATNVTMAVFFKFLEAVSPVFSVGVYLNLLLALFNTLPMPSLDGLKVFSWSIIPWSVLFSTELILLLLVDILSLALILPIIIGAWIFLFLWLQRYTEVRF